MKTSRYNYVLCAPDGTTLLFNFYTLNLISLRDGREQLAQLLLADPNRQGGDAEETSLKELLADKGFILRDEVDELALLRQANIRSRYGRRDLSLTIAPTLACNFRCVYCYQPPSGSLGMSQETQDALVRFADARLVQGGSLNVTWFGGEPLARPDIVYSLSKTLIEGCRAKEADYTASMITNGYLCDRTTAKKLAELKVRSLQITLDGPPLLHDQRRVTKNGQPTFQRILENIRQIHDIVRINIRMNVDTNNRDMIDDMLDLLVAEGLQRSVGFYIGQVQPYTEVCRDISEHCLSDERFSLLGLQTLMKMSARGFTSTFNMPQSTNCSCIADNLYGFVIAPSGTVGKCWNEVANPAAASGHLLLEQTLDMENNCLRWQKRDPFALECVECVLLPICMGGCPYTFLQSGQVDCHRWKFHIDESLLFYYYLKRVEREGDIISQFENLLETVVRLKGSGTSPLET